VPAGAAGGGGSSSSSSSSSSSCSSSSSKAGTDPDEHVTHTLPLFRDFHELMTFGVERSARVQVELSDTDPRTTYLVLDETNSLKLILLQIPFAASRLTSDSVAAGVGIPFNPVPAACRLPGGMVKTKTFWLGGFCPPDRSLRNLKHPQGAEFLLVTQETHLIRLPRFNGFACLMVDLSLAPASLKEEFKTEIRSMRVLCTYVSGRYGGKNAEVQEDDEKAFMFCLEVLDKTLLENKEKSIISDVPETCILSIVRVGDRFYDLHQKTVSTGVVVSFVTENLVGVIFDSDRTYHIFPKILFGNRFVYVRIPSIITFLPS